MPVPPLPPHVIPLFPLRTLMSHGQSVPAGQWSIHIDFHVPAGRARLLSLLDGRADYFLSTLGLAALSGVCLVCPTGRYLPYMCYVCVCRLRSTGVERSVGMRE